MFRICMHAQATRRVTLGQLFFSAQSFFNGRFFPVGTVGARWCFWSLGHVLKCCYLGSCGNEFMWREF